ncbi:BrnT family toxin [Vitreimonas flagellata]|uniref:BrnT family toxin n=1 Tax=Vitreimonas flagellata TaxID=2560861 RepID=UPI003B839662
MGVEWIDDSETFGEERAILLGMAGNGLLMVVHTDRSYGAPQRIRLISARRATRVEQDFCYRENG